MEENKEETETECWSQETILGVKVHLCGFNCQLEWVHTVKRFRNELFEISQAKSVVPRQVP